MAEKWPAPLAQEGHANGPGCHIKTVCLTRATLRFRRPTVSMRRRGSSQNGLWACCVVRRAVELLKVTDSIHSSLIWGSAEIQYVGSYDCSASCNDPLLHWLGKSKGISENLKAHPRFLVQLHRNGPRKMLLLLGEIKIKCAAGPPSLSHGLLGISPWSIRLSRQSSISVSILKLLTLISINTNQCVGYIHPRSSWKCVDVKFFGGRLAKQTPLNSRGGHMHNRRLKCQCLTNMYKAEFLHGLASVTEDNELRTK